MKAKNNNKNLIVSDGCCIQYGDTLALDNVNFSINKGKRVAVVGPNGGGKSTLFNAMTGLIPIANGSIKIYGEDPEDAVLRELHEETGIEGQNPRVLYILGAPGRDPRKHCVGLFYLVDADIDTEPKGADDAVSAAWVPIDELTKDTVAADHLDIVDMLRE